MSRFTGRCRKGALRELRKTRRRQAQERNEATPKEKRRAFREGRPRTRRAAAERMTAADGP